MANIIFSSGFCYFTVIVLIFVIKSTIYCSLDSRIYREIWSKNFSSNFAWGIYLKLKSTFFKITKFMLNFRYCIFLKWLAKMLILIWHLCDAELEVKNGVNFMPCWYIYIYTKSRICLVTLFASNYFQYFANVKKQKLMVWKCYQPTNRLTVLPF